MTEYGYDLLGGPRDLIKKLGPCRVFFTKASISAVSTGDCRQWSQCTVQMGLRFRDQGHNDGHPHLKNG